MNTNKIFISHGDLIVDKIYDSNLHLIKQDGGGSNWNTLYNLAYMGETCYAFGGCGKDEEGDLAIASLNRCGIQTKYIKRLNHSTNVMNILIPEETQHGDDTILHSWHSPITNRCTFFFSEELPTDFPEELTSNQVYVLLDKFETVNQDFLDHIPNKKVCLDVGHIRFMEHFSKPYLATFFQKADVMQLNQNVAPLLLERLQLPDEAALFDFLGLELLILTQGKKGATFLFREEGRIQSIQKSPELIAEAIDTSGAGDAFFSTMIQAYAYAHKVNIDFLTTAFSKANKNSREVISQLGSRREKNS